MVMFLKDIVPCGIIFIECVVITVAMVMLLGILSLMGLYLCICYNHCHSNAVRGFLGVCLPSLCFLVVDYLLNSLVWQYS
jgi:hypothetical protein